MKSLKWLMGIALCLFLSSAELWGQAESTDTTIYKALEEMPRFPACEQLDTTIAFKNQCAQQSLLKFMYQYIVYPQEAREQELEGQVVVSFVVEKDGSISQPKILKDIGGGAGLEVLRVVQEMNEAGIAWVPGMKNGAPVRAQFTLPIRFELEEAKPYVLAGRDTIYIETEKPLEFEGGTEALTSYLEQEVKYPEEGYDSCMVGRIEIQILVRPDGNVRILDLTDYNDLGFDFWYAAIAASTSTSGMWEPAVYEGRKVTTAFDLSLPFLPENEGCATRVEQFTEANKLANEGAVLFNDGEKEAGIDKLSEAIGLFPDNAEFLLMRGQAYLDGQEFDKACADLRKARRISLVNYYDDVLPIICGR